MKLNIGTILNSGLLGKLKQAINGEANLELPLPAVVLSQGRVGSGNESLAIEITQQAIKQGASVIYIDRVANGMSGSNLNDLPSANVVSLQSKSADDLADIVLSGTKENKVLYCGIPSLHELSSQSEEVRLNYFANLIEAIMNSLKNRMNHKPESRNPLVIVFSGCLSALGNVSEHNKKASDSLLDRLSVLVAQSISVNTTLLFSECDIEATNKYAVGGFLDGNLSCLIDLSASSPMFSNSLPELNINTNVSPSLPLGEALVWRKYPHAAARVILPHLNRSGLTQTAA